MTTPESDLAYDGSNAPPLRELTARERDIMCRIISDIFGEFRRSGVGVGGVIAPIRLDSNDMRTLLEVRQAIDPRRET